MYSRNTLPSLTSVPFLGRLSGSYEDLQRGQVSEALVDFTGGVTMTIKLAEAPDSLWDVLTRATYSRTLIGCQTHCGVRLGCALAGQRTPHSPSLHPPAAALASVNAPDSPNSLTQSPDNTLCASLVAQRLKRLPGMRETRARSLGWEDPLEKEMATHSSTLAWRIPWREEPGRLQSMGS